MINSADGDYIYYSGGDDSERFRNTWQEHFRKLIKESDAQRYSGNFVTKEDQWLFKTVKYVPWGWYVTIAIKNSVVSDVANEYFSKSIMLLVFLSAVIVFITMAFFRVHIIRPLEQIKYAVINFQDNRIPVSFEHKGMNIIGDLAKSVEETTEAVSHYESRLQELNAELEDKYSKAYKDLIDREHKFRNLFENMLLGCAYHRIITERGVPVDYEFIDINKAF